jgi:tRNA-dihydrouridine synthase
MVSAKGMYYSDKKSFELTAVTLDEQPAAVQIFGSDPGIMAKAAYTLNSSGAAIIDINMGCPTPKITKNGEGCALMKNPRLAGEIIRTVANASDNPVTVKFRKGWDDSDLNAVEFAKLAEDSGASAITVHGRTREQFYSGKADWSIIGQVKKAVSIPVIGNGDITCARNALDMFAETGCDAVMVGRGALGNPWIFREIGEAVTTTDGPTPDCAVYPEPVAGAVSPPPSPERNAVYSEPSPEEKAVVMKKHLRLAVDMFGERVAVLEMRKHFAWYVKGMYKAASLKNKIFGAKSSEEILGYIDLINSIGCTS